ncbi:MAG: DNA methyltransferase [Verrucomicrobiota bacterium]|jgi:type II restriction/modification system DNA methylase subunit YeeA
MTPAEFKTKWAKVSAKESAAYQSHFDDLCRLLKLPTPLEADPKGEFFCFQKRVVKDVELFELHETPDASEPTERGFADVWKKGCFAWEYKGRKKNLDEAYRQLLRYRESLLNPPLLVVCDFDRYIIRTNFNGTVQETHEFTNDQIDRPENLRILRALFTDPEFLKPQRTTAQVTKTLAEKFAQVAVSLQKRESAEYADARTREEFRVEQKKNLRIARFLNRLVFCFFAEDTGLLPKNLFSEIAKIGLENKDRFIETLQRLFRVMAKGGNFGKDKIRYFNGHLFEDSTVFDLSDDERRILAEASEADWQFVEPSIMGTLFARGLDPDQRAALGAQYTSREDIVTIVEPVLMAPLRREWAALKASLLPALKHGKATPADRARIAAFLKKLRQIIVLDPACGSGNFLYVSLQLLLGLEKEVVTFATQLGFKFAPQVSVQQLRAIEINPYAFELAQVSVQIGYLQWLRDNGFPLDRSPVLQNLDGFHNEDALLVPHFHSKAKTLKEAQAGEHKGDDALKFYTEREWPKCDVIVSNPPFLGGQFLRRELGNSYTNGLFTNYENRIPSGADLCCYWFEKARQQIEHGKCKRAGLLATQGIRGGANREVLKHIKETGDIFFAESDRPWILAGANVHVSMVGFDNGLESNRIRDGVRVDSINPNLTTDFDLTTAKVLLSNANLCFRPSEKGGDFELTADVAHKMLMQTNPNGLPNSSVLRRWINGDIILKKPAEFWIVDFGEILEEPNAAQFEAPFEHLKKNVRDSRQKNSDKRLRRFWWLHRRSGEDMRNAVAQLDRMICTPRVAKHRVFVWIPANWLPDTATYVFARNDDLFFGVLHSRFHEVWALKQGTRLETRPRYTPTTCFETFPFPRPTAKQEAAIAAAAKELNELRERWLNPPEWTETRTLEFRGTVGGPWNRYISPESIEEITLPGQDDLPEAERKKFKVGTVSYPRLEPKDAKCAAELKKRTLTNLYNERPAWLDNAHKTLDAAVAAAYGWPADLTDEQILEKLLALNLARAAEEAKAAKVKKPKMPRDKKEDEMI